MIRINRLVKSDCPGIIFSRKKDLAYNNMVLFCVFNDDFMKLVAEINID